MERKCRNPRCEQVLEVGDGTYDGYCDQNCKWQHRRQAELPLEPNMQLELQLPPRMNGIYHGRSPIRR